MTLPPVQDKVRELCGYGTTSMQEVLERLTAICEKPINLIEFKEDWGALTAFKAEFEDRINVYFPPQKSQQYKLHCIYHELGHIYLENLRLALALPDLSGEMLRETADAISSQPPGGTMGGRFCLRNVKENPLTHLFRPRSFPLIP
jgi:hypothetical protein